MKRHVKVRGVYDPETKRVSIHVMTQTHLGKDFGPKPVRYNSSRFVHGRFALCSANGPGWYVESNSLYLKGNERCYDEYPVKLTLSQWEDAKAAINAYNEWGATL